MEADWRYFRDLVPRVRERYLAERIEEIRGLLAQPGKTPTACFWEAFEFMEREVGVLRCCLDGHSRSEMRAFLGQMIRSRMLRREDMAGFSQELRESLLSALEEEEGG